MRMLTESRYTNSKCTVPLFLTLTTPLLASGPQVTTTTQITETKSLSEYQKQGSGVPTPEELTAQSVADLASARAASIAASQAWYQWDKGAAAEQEIELPRGSIN
jgi:hypothetical protein